MKINNLETDKLIIRSNKKRYLNFTLHVEKCMLK